MNPPPGKSRIASRRGARATAPENSPASAAGKATRSAARPESGAAIKEKGGVQWTFLTNHSHVMVLLARNSSLVLREVAQQVGITERAVQRIIAELEAGGFVKREKVGRQNHYKIQTNRPLRHPIEAHRTIGDLLNLLNSQTR